MATLTTTPPPTAVSATTTATCITATPDRYGYVPPEACNSYYNYYPNFSANLAFAALFGLTTAIHIVQAVIFKKRYCWVLIMGGLWETAAFIIRTLGAHDQQQEQYAIWGLLLLLLAPLWINAFAYMTGARMVYFGLPEKKILGVRATKLTVLFVWLDIVCFIVQVGGGVLLSGDNSSTLLNIGMKIYTAGIGLQLGFVVIFTGMIAFFYHKMHQATGNVGRMRFLIWGMLVVLALIFMRIVYRLVEFGPGVSHSNPLLSHEIYPFMLDGFPMLLALTTLNVIHPGMVLRGLDADFPRLTRAEKKAKKQLKKDLKMQKKEAKRQRKAAKKNGSIANFELLQVPSQQRSTDLEASPIDRDAPPSYT